MKLILCQLSCVLGLWFLGTPATRAQFAVSDTGLRALADGSYAVWIAPNAAQGTTVSVYVQTPNLVRLADTASHWFEAQYVASEGIDYLYNVPALRRQYFIRKTLAMQPGEPMNGLMVYLRELTPDMPPCNLQPGTFSLVPNGGHTPADPRRPIFFETGILQPAGQFATREAAAQVLIQQQMARRAQDSLELRFELLEPRGPDTYKPIVYLYADLPTACYVRATPATPFTALYPGVDANGGWHVTTQPSGLLLNARDSILYPSLFWEAPTAAAPATPVPAWRWHRTELAPQLETRLDSLGLSPRERTEFIQFWLPRLAAHEWVSVSFGWQVSSPGAAPRTAPGWESYFAANGLEITPAPAQTLRLMMAWQPAPVPGLAPAATALPRLARTGFYAVEWGGFLWPDAQTIRVMGW